MEMIIYVKYPHKSYVPSLITNPSSRGGGPSIVLEDFRMKPSFTLFLLKKDISRRMSIPISQISFLNDLPSSLPPQPSSSSSSCSSSSTSPSSPRDSDSMTISESGILPGTTLELNTQGKIVLAVLRTHLKLVRILIVDPKTTIRDIKEMLVDAPALREMGKKPLSMALKRPWPTPGTMWAFDDVKWVGECMTGDQADMGGVTFTVGELKYADQELEE